MWIHPRTPQVAVSRQLATALVLTWTASSISGCGSSHRPKLGTVSGTVTLDGQPLEGATITFVPGLGRVSRGRSGPDGVYELYYIGNEKGALLGEHKVMIITSWMDEDLATGRFTHYPERLPPKYHAESELTKTVEAGHNRFDFATTSK